VLPSLSSFFFFFVPFFFVLVTFFPLLPFSYPCLPHLPLPVPVTVSRSQRRFLLLLCLSLWLTLQKFLLDKELLFSFSFGSPFSRELVFCFLEVARKEFLGKDLISSQKKKKKDNNTLSSSSSISSSESRLSPPLHLRFGVCY
jgi:hypothetical protein